MNTQTLFPDLLDDLATVDYETVNYQEEKDSDSATVPANFWMLHAMIEGLFDGVLILTPDGHVVQSNSYGAEILDELYQRQSTSNPLPEPLWRICQLLVESRVDFPDQVVMIEDEIETDCPAPIRVRARWLTLSKVEQPCILVTLEDCYQTACQRAIAESHQYGLTQRESEVWLLKRANYSYEQIAAKLYIAINTVKKHLKSIYAKQQDAINSREAY